MREKLSAIKEVDENLNSLLESLNHGLKVLQGVEENLTFILESFSHNQEIMEGTVKECMRH